MEMSGQIQLMQKLERYHLDSFNKKYFEILQTTPRFFMTRKKEKCSALDLDRTPYQNHLLECRGFLLIIEI